MTCLICLSNQSADLGSVPATSAYYHLKKAVTVWALRKLPIFEAREKQGGKEKNRELPLFLKKFFFS